MNTKLRGELTEARIRATLLQFGFSVLEPFGESCRYDLVTEYEGNFERIQCKTGRRDGEVIRFATRSTRPRGNGYSRADYTGDIDYFAVQEIDRNQTYIIPIVDAPSTEMALRVEQSKNGQTKGINRAVEYRVSEWIDSLKGT